MHRTCHHLSALEMLLDKALYKFTFTLLYFTLYFRMFFAKKIFEISQF